MKMKIMLVIFVLLIMAALRAVAEVPRFINYTGFLTDEQGKPLPTNNKQQIDLKFSLYPVAAGGISTWDETHVDVPVDNGNFSLLLGSITRLDPTNFPLGTNFTIWLETEVTVIEPNKPTITTILEPRTEIVSTPYAFNADMLDGYHADELGAVINHGTLQGLTNDDHTQYHNDTRGDDRYAGESWDGTTTLASAHSHIADTNNPHATDHGALGGLLDDDHTQYSGGANWNGTTTLASAQNHIADTNNPHATDHGALGGLLDDDHTQYSGGEDWNETTTLASLDTHVTNLWGTIGFVVGQTGREPYSSVQDAIDAASDVGFGQTNQVTIEVKPGTYRENLTFQAGIHLKAEIEDALFSVTIEGTNQYVDNTPGLDELFISGIWFISPDDATAPTFSIAGNGFASIRMNHCVLQSQNNMPALQLSNTGTQDVRLTNTEMFHCRIRNTQADFSEDRALVELTAGSLLMRRADVSLVDLAERAFLVNEVNGDSQLIIDNAEISGRIETAGGAADRFNLIISQSSIDTGGNLPCIEHNAINAAAFEVLFISTNAGDVVTGNGIFLYNNLAYLHSVDGLDQTLAATLSYGAGAVPIGTENAYNLIYRTTEGADWTDRFGIVPLNVNLALDALVDVTDSHIDDTNNPHDTDHGALGGLADDDHTQYHNDTRGDIRYAGAGWDTTTTLRTAQDHIADTNNPHAVTLGQLGGIAEESDPTVTNWVKDGVTWEELKGQGMPAGFSDDIDDVGITSEDDPQVGDITDNYVPRWNGNALVTGTIYDDPGTGNIGIGTKSPATKLEVDGSGATPTIQVEEVFALNRPQATSWPNFVSFRVGQYAAEVSGLTRLDIALKNSANANIVDLTTVMTMTGDGRVGIGKTPDAGIALDVNGWIQLNAPDFRIQAAPDDWGTPVLGFRGIGLQTGWTVLVPNFKGFRVMNCKNNLINLELDNWGNLSIAGSLTEGSDSRGKLNLKPLEYGLAETLKLQPQRYDRAEFSIDSETGELEVDEENTEPDIGLVAQQVNEVIPEAVRKPEDESKETWGIKYSKVLTVMVKAIQEQQEQIDELKQEIEALKGR